MPHYQRICGVIIAFPGPSDPDIQFLTNLPFIGFPRRKYLHMLQRWSDRAALRHFTFEPLDFIYRMYGIPRPQGCAGAAIAKLAAQVAKPGVDLSQFNCVFVGVPRHSNNKHRSHVTPSRRGKVNTTQQQGDKTIEYQHSAMIDCCYCKIAIHTIQVITRAQRLTRVFDSSAPARDRDRDTASLHPCRLHRSTHTYKR